MRPLFWGIAWGVLLLASRSTAGTDGCLLGRPIGAWVDRLSSMDRKVRLRAVQVLEGCRPSPELESAISALTACLRDPDPPVRIAAASALERIGIGGAEVVSALAAATADAHQDVRLRATAALRIARGTTAPAAVQALTRIAVASGDFLDRATAVTALTCLGAEAQAALPALEGARKLLSAEDPAQGLLADWMGMAESVIAHDAGSRRTSLYVDATPIVLGAFPKYGHMSTA
jgi:HEAT repeat protein